MSDSSSIRAAPHCASGGRSLPSAAPRKNGHGGVAEWLKAHAWRACIRATVSRVRIPLPPPPSCSTRFITIWPFVHNHLVLAALPSFVVLQHAPLFVPIRFLSMGNGLGAGGRTSGAGDREADGACC